MDLITCSDSGFAARITKPLSCLCTAVRSTWFLYLKCGMWLAGWRYWQACTDVSIVMVLTFKGKFIDFWQSPDWAASCLQYAFSHRALHESWTAQWSHVMLKDSAFSTCALLCVDLKDGNCKPMTIYQLTLGHADTYLHVPVAGRPLWQ